MQSLTLQTEKTCLEVEGDGSTGDRGVLAIFRLTGWLSGNDRKRLNGMSNEESMNTRILPQPSVFHLAVS